MSTLKNAQHHQPLERNMQIKPTMRNSYTSTLNGRKKLTIPSADTHAGQLECSRTSDSNERLCSFYKNMYHTINFTRDLQVLYVSTYVHIYNYEIMHNFV